MSPAGEGISKLRLLVVDQDTVISAVCREWASALGLVAEIAVTPHVVRNRLSDGFVDVLLVDLDTLLGEGLALLDEIRELHPSVGVIVMFASALVTGAAEALRAGATEVIPKPFTRSELTTVLERTMERCLVAGVSRRLGETLHSPHSLGNIVGRSPEMDKLQHLLSRVVKSSHPVLIMGERGVGKELVARTIHANGVHADRPFVSVDCSSLAPALMASELFGFVKDSSEGADQPKSGFSTTLPGGTIFLDNIGELTMNLQAKLFHALERKDFRFAKVSNQIAVQVRVLAAADHTLATIIKKGYFRMDLYHRLNVVHLFIPSLRDRRQDIPLLATHFLEQISRKTGITHTLSIDVLQTLVKYEWPGNVRELENSIATACSRSPGFVLQIGDLPVQLQSCYLEAQRAAQVVSTSVGSSEPQQGSTCSAAVIPIADLEKQAILNALSSSKGDRVSIARKLGIGKTTLYRKLKEYGVGKTESV